MSSDDKLLVNRQQEVWRRESVSEISIHVWKSRGQSVNEEEVGMQSSQGEEERRRRRRAKVNKIKIYLSKVLKVSRDNLAWKTCPRIRVHRKRVLWKRSESAGGAALWDSKKIPGKVNPTETSSRGDRAERRPGGRSVDPAHK